MKIGLAQINTTVGDIAGNQTIIVEAYRSLCKLGAEIILFPELAVCGYPPRDLLFRSRFAADCKQSLREIASITGNVPALIGSVDDQPCPPGRRLWNIAAWCHNGQVHTVARKSLLPTYDVFDEERYFEPSDAVTCVSWNGLKLGLTICEDLWHHPEFTPRHGYRVNPVDQLAKEQVDFIFNISASPWHAGKPELREKVIGRVADLCHAPVAYCNSVGGNDELIFDGRSFAIAPGQRILGGLPGFRSDCGIIDTGIGIPQLSASYTQDQMADIYEALVLGLRDYAVKSGFRKVVIGLSGGIDSAVTAAIAVSALGNRNVIGISLPSAISSQHSRDDAEDLARNLGIEYHSLSISDLVEAAEHTLAPLFSGRRPDVTEENIQARARGLLMMAISNKFGALLLTTGNKSELSVGYCTLYGDMCGGLAVLSDVLKSQVYELANYINRRQTVIPVSTIEKPPSAELRPGQRDSDSLPDYAVLDAILRLYIEKGQSRADIVAAGYPRVLVDDIARKVDLNEYKRKQAAPGLKISPLAFGIGRRIPIVQRYVN